MNDLNFKNDSSREPFFKRKKTCPFSGPNAPIIDYKDVKLISRYVTERGKIIPSPAPTFQPNREHLVCDDTDVRLISRHSSAP
jgi:ribosomal protein S18